MRSAMSAFVGVRMAPASMISGPLRVNSTQP